ncbi:hypothetical protein LEP1GSC034_1718 [Leptospira interrogans str. 2003000735]|uniref:Uncharacterized protein n=10 Tax=Leptospira TaxID=171 RepID=A0A0E2D429_LEPIR|nr:hypothetical protein G436_0236 [Leptospira interrogans serovar Hardjo str. Norma]EJP01749.1 hypothetical protein LEP1GSC007_4123 [Leptospira interrogans serovar Bulgarica str. Mallika]EJP17540.1 hypothetical protein LEP1GSC080_4000 [Leptospira interrogans str. FPW2026]EKN96241.1 hypothetical protein LEP1GSC014_3185 [Leptospira interrogans serovar Pomona str. Pomona]EKO06224.1 hypothetical protein LEP1GSC077_2424 [Leptospira interrogans str. C10069]EKO17633.1 hypothetical protein LEP1GSC081_
MKSSKEVLKYHTRKSIFKSNESVDKCKREISKIVVFIRISERILKVLKYYFQKNRFT